MVELAGVGDVLVFEWRDDSFHLVGGRGRGEGWANIVEFDPSEAPHVERAWRGGVPIRVNAEEPTRICGPYWSTAAVIVPVGQEHLVVFGGDGVNAVSDAVLLGEAARTVAATGGMPAEKLLADELEVAHAVRALATYHPLTVRETARHIATVAARALSCEVAAVSVAAALRPTLEVIELRGGEAVEADPTQAGRDAGPFLNAAATMAAPMVEQAVGPDPQVWTQDVVSRMTLPIAPQVGMGALSLGHARGHERGFTSLCQRIGRALAESAEALLAQAIERENLTAETERYQRATMTDPLTGVGNRAAWASVMEVPPPTQVPGAYAVLSVDLDELKFINDHYGHAAGDAVLSGAANLLRATLRASDVLCRVGGDEFLCLLPDAGEREARAVMRRIDRAVASWRVTEHGLTPRISVGWAVFHRDWETTVEEADDRMYAIKRRRRIMSRSQNTAPTREVRTRGRRTDVEPPPGPAKREPQPRMPGAPPIH